MTTQTTKTPLAKIRPIALKLVERLHPYCEKIEIAGSIRRGKPLVKDIEIVTIPKMHYQHGLFGISSQVISNELLEFLDGLASSDAITKGFS